MGPDEPLSIPCDGAVPRPPPSVLVPPPPPNTSGGGKDAIVPPEIEERWNWAAFLVPFLFAFAYLSPMWIALGAIPIVMGVFEDRVPGGGFASSVAALVIGISFARRANAVAWRARRWESVERFRRVQRWSGWSALLISFVLVAAVTAASADFPGTGTTADVGGFSRYEDHDISVEYPSAWILDPPEDVLIDADPIRRNSRWVVFIAPPGADLVTVALLDVPPITARQLSRAKHVFAANVASGGDGTVRGTVAEITVGSAPGISFTIDGTGLMGAEMTTEVVAVVTRDGLLILRCDYERDDPNGTARGCRHMVATLEVAGP